MKDALVSKSDFDKFRGEQNEQHNEINKKLDKLEPLGDLIPTLQEMVKNQEAATRAGRWFMKFVGFIALILGALYTLFKMMDIR